MQCSVHGCNAAYIVFWRNSRLPLGQLPVGYAVQPLPRGRLRAAAAPPLQVLKPISPSHIRVSPGAARARRGRLARVAGTTRPGTTRRNLLSPPGHGLPCRRRRRRRRRRAAAAAAVAAGKAQRTGPPPPHAQGQDAGGRPGCPRSAALAGFLSFLAAWRPLACAAAAAAAAAPLSLAAVSGALFGGIDCNRPEPQPPPRPPPPPAPPLLAALHQRNP